MFVCCFNFRFQGLFSQKLSLEQCVDAQNMESIVLHVINVSIILMVGTWMHG